MAVDSFIFGGNTGLTYEQLKRRRAIAQALASQRRGYPKTIGEGLTYLGESIGDTLAERRLDAAERAQAIGDRAALNPPMTAPSAPAPVAPPVRPALPVPPPPVRPPPAPAPPRPQVSMIPVRPTPSDPYGATEGTGEGFEPGGILNPTPMTSDLTPPPGMRGDLYPSEGTPSSSFIPSTAAAPPSTLPAPAAVPPVSAMDFASWPQGPIRRPTDTQTEPGTAPPPVTAPAAPAAPAAALGPQSGLDPLTDFMRRTEGFSATAKPDYKQYSIGYGTKGRPGQTMTREEAEAPLQKDLAEARGYVEAFAPNAPPGIKNALTSLTFNAGPGWQQAGLGRLIKEGRYDEARDRFLQYNKAGGQERLVNRRNAEIAQFWNVDGTVPARDQPDVIAQEMRPLPQRGGEGATLASYAPSGVMSDAPVPGMGGAGAMRIRPQIPPLPGPPAPPDEQVTPTDIEPMPATAQLQAGQLGQFGPPTGRFSRTDAPLPGVVAPPPQAPAVVPPLSSGAGSRPPQGPLPPMRAGEAVPPPIEPMDPGPEPRMPGPTPTMLHYRNVASDPNRSELARGEAAARYAEEAKNQRTDFTNQWTIWKTEKLKFDDPSTRLKLRHEQVTTEKAIRDLEGEGFMPLTPAELAGLPKPPEGQIIYKNRRGELKFGPTPPASTTVNIDQKATGKGQEKLQEKMAEQFVEMFTTGTTAADDLRTITEMRELTARVNTGPEAVAKQFAGRWGIKTEGISNIEALNAMINRVVPQQRVPGAGATSDFDARMFQQSVPALMNTQGGNALIMDTMEGVARNKMARAEVAGKVVSGQLTIAEGVKETLALQAQAKAMSDRVRDHIEKGGSGAATTGPTMSRENQRALDWATQNPQDPRSQKVKERLGVP